LHTTGTVVIGAGQAGLAASRHLADRGHDHVVLERARVGQRWLGMWDSLRLLTPNWMNNLPGRPYRGPDPDGFAAAATVTRDLADYARSFGAPVVVNAAVTGLSRQGNGFEVVTDGAVWRAAQVVLATGWCDRPAIPAAAEGLPASVHQLAPDGYRNPDSVPPGGVLVVGASATGVQLADELRAAGRDVTIAVGGHTRVPRTYRGMDIYWWLDRLGALDRTIDQLPDPARARHEPSAQLVGSPGRRTLDLTTLQADGVRLVGRVLAADGHRVRLAADLPATTLAADVRMRRLLGRIDRHVDECGLRAEVGEPDHPRTIAPARIVLDLDLRAAGIGTVLWATGHRRAYPWLHLPVLDAHGEIRQRRGRTPVPGLYVLGQRFQYRRDSNFIGGVGRDAATIADHIAGPSRLTQETTHAQP